MNCVFSCSLAAVFLFSMMYMLIMVDKSGELVKVLNPEQMEIYKKIVIERRNLMIVGYIIGLTLSAVMTLYVNNKSLQVCYAIIITYMTSYFYYTLMPKSDYMLLHLTNEQNKAWLDVYLKMKNNYHLSFLLGMLFVGFAVYGY